MWNGKMERSHSKSSNCEKVHFFYILKIKKTDEQPKPKNNCLNWMTKMKKKKKKRKLNSGKNPHIEIQQNENWTEKKIIIICKYIRRTTSINIWIILKLIKRKKFVHSYRSTQFDLFLTFFFRFSFFFWIFLTQYSIAVQPSIVIHWNTVNMAKPILSKLVMP